MQHVCALLRSQLAASVSSPEVHTEVTLALCAFFKDWGIPIELLNDAAQDCFGPRAATAITRKRKRVGPSHPRRPGRAFVVPAPTPTPTSAPRTLALTPPPSAAMLMNMWILQETTEGGGGGGDDGGGECLTSAVHTTATEQGFDPAPRASIYWEEVRRALMSAVYDVDVNTQRDSTPASNGSNGCRDSDGGGALAGPTRPPCVQMRKFTTWAPIEWDADMFLRQCIHADPTQALHRGGGGGEDMVAVVDDVLLLHGDAAAVDDGDVDVGAVAATAAASSALDYGDLPDDDQEATGYGGGGGGIGRESTEGQPDASIDWRQMKSSAPVPRKKPNQHNKPRYLRDHLEKLRVHETPGLNDVPPSVIDSVRRYCAMTSRDPRAITNWTEMLELLKRSGIKQYKHVHRIVYILSGHRCFQFTERQERDIVDVFEKAMRAWEEIRGRRKSMLNYPAVLYLICDGLHLDGALPYLSLQKTPSTAEETLQHWYEICAVMESQRPRTLSAAAYASS